ncbi:MAG: autotransporter domain-containing protein [Rhodobacter sp.]|nr:autotransporter domain-containing protein [Rhodobacter sp.]
MMRLSRTVRTFLATLGLMVAGGLAAAQPAPPTIDKAFSTDPIAPGGVSQITLTITNPNPSEPVSDIAFTDALPSTPGIMDVADGAAATTCVGSTLSAPEDATSIVFSDGGLGGGESCVITVNVTASDEGLYTNAAFPFSSSLGPGTSAAADLTVLDGSVGFDKSFSPDTVSLGGTSTLTFTIDNTDGEGPIANLDFTDILPTGMEIASPANASTTCVSAGFPSTTLTATPGSSTIVLDADGSTTSPGFEVLAAGATCTVTVDVTATGGGELINTAELLVDFGDPILASGTLNVTVDPLNLSKEFVTNPVNAGDDTVLRFTLENFNRTEAATAVAFTDDLAATLGSPLPGLLFTALESNSCGGLVSGVGTNLISFSGGVIAPAGTCIIEATVTVPAGAVGGTYLNTTSSLTGSVGGEMVYGTPATDDLIVPAGGGAPALTLEILDTIPPLPGPGDDVVFRFTIQDNSTAGSTDLAATLELAPPLATSVVATLPLDPCGTGSTLSLLTGGFGERTLSLEDGVLGAGLSCSFDVTVTIPAGTPGGDYLFTTSSVTGTVSGSSVTGPGDSDYLTVSGGLGMLFSKAFSENAAPGGTVDLSFVIGNTSDFTDATAINFTDDLSLVLSGLTAGVATVNTCGGVLSGTSMLSYTGGSLSAGGSCTITVPVTVPALAAPGTYTNTTTALRATPAGGTEETFGIASAPLTVAGVTFSKTFLTNPVIAGGTTILRFTIENQHPTLTAMDSGIAAFTDSLAAILPLTPDITATGGPSVNTCGGALTGTTSLTYTGLDLAPLTTCTIEVELSVPAGAADGTYANVTSALATTVGTADAASASLTVQSTQLALTKSFTDDPVAPGDTVTLEFTLTNENTSLAATGVEFSDDLAAMLTGTIFTSVLLDDCSATISGIGTSLIDVEDVALAAGASCTIRTLLTIPGGAAAGAKTNTTSSVFGLLNGFSVTGDPASDTLDISTVGTTFSKSFGGPTIPGGSTTLTFTITNPNATVLTGLSFTDDLGAVLSGLEATSLPATPCGPGSSITGTDVLSFSGGELAASGGMCSFIVDVTVPVPAAAGVYTNTTSDLTSSGLFSASPAMADLTVNAAVDVSVSKDDGVTSATPGDSVIYTIVAANAGPSDDPSVAFNDTFPGNLSCTYSSVAAGGATGNSASATPAASITDTLSLPASSSVTYTATCAIDPSATGTLSNSATATASINDLVPTNNSAADTNTVLTPSADVSVSKTDGVTSAIPGGSLTYTIVAANAGPSNDPSVVFADTFPSELSCTYGSVAGGGATGNSSSGTPVSGIADGLSLPAGGSVTYTVACDIAASATGTLNNSASVIGSVSDPVPGNNTAADTDTLLMPSADISVTKTDGLTSATPGAGLVYTIIAANAGPSDDPAVEVDDTFPPELSCSYSSSESGGASGNSSSATPVAGISDTLSLPVGASVTYLATCTIDPTATGTLSNTASASPSVFDPDDGNNVATDADTRLAPEADISITKTDGATAARAGGSLTYSIVVSNAGPSVDTGVIVSDTFPPELSCTYSSTASGGATGGSSSPTPVAAFSDTLSMPVGSSVTYTVPCAISATASGALTNTATATASATDPATGNNSATDGDTIVDPATLDFSKVFAPDSINQGAETTLTFTIDNTGNVVAATSLEFTDPFPPGIVVAADPMVSNTCGGTFTATPEDPSVALTGGTVGAGGSCTISVVVRADDAGAFDNLTTDLMSSLPTVGGASDTLTANPSGTPLFSKEFADDTIAQGAETVLTFTVDNTANATEATGLTFADPFPPGMVVAETPGVDNGCGGTFTATAGDTSVGLAGGTVAASTSCTIEVTVRALEAGTLDNETSDLTSSLPPALAATDTLTVNAAVAPVFMKAFADETISQGAETVLTFTVDNTANAIEATGLTFTDPFPPGMQVADTPGVDNGCGGTFTATAGATTVDLAGGTVAAGALCTIEVTVRALDAGGLDNETGDLTSSLPDALGATDSLTVNTAVAPGFTKAFADEIILQGAETVLTFTIDNTANAIEATDLLFTDPFPPGLVVADTPGVDNGCGGTFTATAGAETVDLAGGTVAAGAVCTVDVTVRALVAGALDNETGDLTSSLAPAGSATDTLNVTAASPPGFSKAFDPGRIDQGATATLRFTIDNSANAIEATDLDFTDQFPEGLIVAAAPGVVNDCGGAVTATALEDSVALTGGTVAAGASCTIEVTVQALLAGSLLNTTSALTSSLADAAATSATLAVDAVPLSLSLGYAPAEIEQTQTSTSTYTLQNTAAIDASAVALSDTLPAGVTIASPSSASTTCSGGALSAPAGGTSVSLSGGSLAAGASCTITVDVTSAIVGSYPNTTESATSSLGTSANASATLTVNPATTGTVTIVQETDTDGDYVFSSAEALLNFTITTAGGAGIEGPITLAVGTYAITQSPPDGVGNTDITCDDGDSTGDPVARTLSISLDPLEAVTCTITSISTRQRTVDTINRFLTKRADLILASEPRPGRRFARLNRGFGNATRLSFATGDLKALLPFTAEISRGSNEYRFSTSLVQMREAAASIELAHGATRDAVYVDNYRFDAWFEAQYKKFDGGADGEGHFAVAYFGADYLVTPDVLVGAVLQIDDMEDVSTVLGSSARGTGWMIGPYMTARLAPNLYFDGRIAAGQSSNEVSPFNTYTDSFSTDRWMAMASLTGEFEQGPWTIRPTASFSYFQETQEGYVDSLGVTIPSQTIELGQIKLGPTFTGRFETDTGMIYAPYFSVDAIYNIGNTSGVTVTNPSTPATEGWRARLQAGVDFTTPGGARISFGGNYDGIGRSGFDVWGLAFDVTIPLKIPKAR